MEQIANVIRLMAELRNCAKTSLPMSDSLIAYDLILYIAITYKEKTPITIKQLFGALPHSYTAVRHHYNRLLKDGYVVHRLDENDRRVKFIEPTEKFIGSLVSYANKAKAILDTPPPSAFGSYFSLVTYLYNRVKTANLSCINEVRVNAPKMGEC